MNDPETIESLLKTLIKGQSNLAEQVTKLGVLTKSLETDQKTMKDDIASINKLAINIQKDLTVLCSRVGVNDDDVTSLNSKINRISRTIRTIEKAVVIIGEDTHVVHDGWIEEASDRRLVQKELADELKGMQEQIDKMEEAKVAAGESS